MAKDKDKKKAKYETQIEEWTDEEIEEIEEKSDKSDRKKDKKRTVYHDSLSGGTPETVPGIYRKFL